MDGHHRHAGGGQFVTYERLRAMDSSRQAMVWPTPTARRGETFMILGCPSGVVGSVVSKGVNEMVIPNYKQTWGNIRKLADQPQSVAGLSFKSQEYRPPA